MVFGFGRRSGRRSVCCRCTRRKLSHFLIEPGIGLILVWGIFSYFSTVPRGRVRRYDVQWKLDPRAAVRLSERSLQADLQGGEDLLFQRQGDPIPHDNVARMALELPELPEEKESERSAKKDAPQFLIGDHQVNDNAMNREAVRDKLVQNQRLLDAEVEQERQKAPVVYHHPTRPWCPGKRWTLTPKTANMYDVMGYSASLQQTTGCSRKACALNEARSPLRLNMSVVPCTVQQCLTVTIKTRFRYENVILFINSIHEEFPGLKVVVMDEEGREKFANQSSIDAWENYLLEKGEYLVTYVQARPGVGFGRKLGAQIANTKYILVVDDDYLFTKLSNVSRLVEVLERSDASIVAGDTSDGFPYAGAFRVARNSSNSNNVHLALYPNVFYELVDCYRNCFVADIVKTFFVADRRAILKAGAWDSERLFYEHEDFFINMRRARLKVVNCKDIKVRHAPQNQKLALLRRESHSIWQKHLLQKWKIEDIYICDKSTYKNTKTTCAFGRHFY